MAEGQKYEFHPIPTFDEMPIHPALQIPEIFKVPRRIHMGSMSIVFGFKFKTVPEAKEYDKEVVIKRLMLDEPKRRQNAFREMATLLATKEHRFIVKLMGAYCPNVTPEWKEDVKRLEQLYLAFQPVERNLREYYELDSVKRAGGPSHAAIARIMLQLTDALLFLHKKCFITHRDLKPSNVGLNGEADGDLEVKLYDFGLVAANEADDSGGMQGRPPSSKGLGTPAYISPESIMGIDFEAPVDVWGLGCILGELMQSKPLFEVKLAACGKKMHHPQQLRHLLICVGNDFTPDTVKKAKDLPENQGDASGIIAVLEMNKELLPEVGTLASQPFAAKISGREGPYRSQSVANCRDLLLKLLKPDPVKRLKLEEVSGEEYFRKNRDKFQTDVELSEELRYKPLQDKEKTTGIWRSRIRDVLLEKEKTNEWKWLTEAVPQ